MILTEAQGFAFRAEWSVFAARVADQRYDADRAALYRQIAADCEKEVTRLHAEAEKCRPLRERLWRALRRLTQTPGAKS